MSWLDRSVREIAAGVLDGRVSAEELTTLAITRLEATQAATHATRHVLRDRAFAAARATDEAVARGERPRLAGLPVALKDNLVIGGEPTSCGSRLLEHWRGSYDAHVVTRLLAAGAVPVATTHMDEFGMGGSTEHCAWGPVRNPWDPTRVPGGSSGGSAAVVAAGAVPVALGSDTGGSIRQPAAFTGIVGMKPTYGRVSRRGLVAFASSLDQVGPLARTVDDAALMLEVLSGPDAGDATSLRLPVPPWADAPPVPTERLRIGVPEQALAEGVDPAIRASLEAALDALAAEGAQIRPVRLPSLDLALACYYILAPAEASANLARFDGIRYGKRVETDTLEDTLRRTRATGFGAEVRRRILVGTYVLSSGYIDAYYRRAEQLRARLRRELVAVLHDLDVLVTPTAPTTAYPLGSRTEPLAMYLGDAFTVPASLAGLPAISVPCGLAEGLPIGLQAMAAPGREDLCFAVARAVERLRPIRRLPAPSP